MNNKQYKYNVFSTEMHTTRFKGMQDKTKELAHSDYLIYNLIKEIDVLNVIISEFNKPYANLDTADIIYDVQDIVFNRKGIYEFNFSTDLIKCLYEKIHKKLITSLNQVLQDDERGVEICDMINHQYWYNNILR